MRLLSRYVLRQLAAPFVFAVAALTSIMMLNQIAKRFGGLVGKGLPWTVIGEVFLLSLPFIVAMTLPMAVLLAVLYAFTTLASSNEITAMRASGVSIGQLLRPVFAAALLLTAADFAFVDQGLPATNLRLKALQFDIGRKRPTLTFAEETLNEVTPNSLFLQAGRIFPEDGRLRDVTIYEMSGQQGQGRQVIYADSGKMGFEASLTDLYLTLYSGSILQFKGADPGLFQLTYFTVNTIRVRSVGNTLERSGDDVPKSEREMTTCEMLVVVNDTVSTIRSLTGERAARLEQDLRSLLALPRAPAAEASPPRRPPWCERLKSTGRRLLPETAEAQAAAQRPTGRPPRAQAGEIPQWKRDLLKERVKSLEGDTLASPTDSAAVANPRPPRTEYGEGGRQVALASWVDVKNTQDGIKAARRTADGFLVEVHKKYAITLACLVFVLVGIPLALRFPRGGMGLVLGGGLGIFALYYVSLTAGEPLADSGILPPALVMWAPNVVFTILGLFGLLRVNRELGSTRGGDLAELTDLVRRRVAAWRRRG